MKQKETRILLLVFLNLLLVSLSTYAQTDTIIIDLFELDKSPTIRDTSFKNLNYGSTYILKIKNFNRNLYKVESKIEQKNYNTEIPEIFKGINLPTYLNLSSTITTETNQKGQNSTKANLKKGKKDSIKKQLEIIEQANKTLLNAKLLSNEFSNLLNSCEKYGSIESNLFGSVKSIINVGEMDRYKQVEQLEIILLDTIQGATQAIEILDTLMPIYISILETDLSPDYKTVTNWPELKPDKEKDKGLFKDEWGFYLDAKARIDSTKIYINSLKEVLTKATETVEELKKFKNENKIQTLIDAYNLINEFNFSYFSKPIKVKGDDVKIDLQVISEKLLTCERNPSPNIKHTFKTKGGWKIDFSGGVFFNAGGQDFLGRELQYTPSTDSTVTIESKDGGKRLLLSLGSLMHIYKRSGKDFNVAISPGVSITSGFDTFNFHLGVSGLFGRKNRGVITVGLTMRETNVLDRNFNYETPYQNNEVPEIPPVIKVFPKWGGFIGFSFNFNGNNNQE